MTPTQDTGGLAGDALGRTAEDLAEDPTGQEAEDTADDPAEQEAELHAGFLTEAVHWLRGLLGPADRAAPAVHRILDLGSGPGVASRAL
ncbi:hypothetical protein GTW71_31000, partial [Streptomyces sp. SID6041]|nr:hypothetical protein [Streptomyces sp. SID6041]